MMLRSTLLRRVQLLNRSLAPQCKTFSEVSHNAGDSIDSCGYRVALSDGPSLELYNLSIKNFLTHQNDPAKELRLLRKTHKNVGMIDALLAFQMMRQPRPSNVNEKNDIDELLRGLEEKYKKGELSEREEHFASAAASFAQGNYLKSAAMMESLFIGRESDIMALKFAQDCYMLAGDTANTLGCVARWIHLFDSEHEHYGSLMGMYAMGLLENGKLADAEEIAVRAVNRTRGMDVWALHALLNTYQTLGRSAELGGVIHDHIGKHSESSVGLSILLFNKGCGLIQRGNYSGSLRAHDDMVAYMAEAPDKEGQIAGSITNATLLLWIADVNNPSALVDERWNYIDSTAGMWTDGFTAGNSDNLTRMSPMNELCRSIAIGAGERCATAALPGNVLRYSLGEDDDDDDKEEKVKDGRTRMTESQLLASLEGKISNVEAHAKVVWEWMRGAANPNYVKPVDPPILTPEQNVEAEVEAEAKLEATALQHQNSLSLLRGLLQGRKTESQSLTDVCPNLLAMQPNIAAMRRIPEAPDAVRMSDRKWGTESASMPLSEAMLAFSRHDYDEASDRFLEIFHTKVLARLGGTITQRDIVTQTMIESLLRCGRMKEAEYLLTERTAMAPNDAQSWRRLASLYGRTGERAQADRAHYTAWQLGIGQGGFGGPK